MTADLFDEIIYGKVKLFAIISWIFKTENLKRNF